mmetsp:Transcript_8647/g.12768  ORF Transcript_8647/g.12768 Transcript_8647/m.12768 type:complete len:402 (+) Transcript_8647:2-1207(+)
MKKEGLNQVNNVAVATTLISIILLSNLLFRYVTIFIENGRNIGLIELFKYMGLNSADQIYQYTYMDTKIGITHLQSSIIPGLSELSEPNNGFIDYKTLEPIASNSFSFSNLQLRHFETFKNFPFVMDVVYQSSPPEMCKSDDNDNSIKLCSQDEMVIKQQVQTSSNLSCFCEKIDLMEQNKVVGQALIMQFDNRYYTWSIRQKKYDLNSRLQWTLESNHPLFYTSTLSSTKPISILDTYSLNDLKEFILYLFVLLTAYSSFRFYIFFVYIRLLKKLKKTHPDANTEARGTDDRNCLLCAVPLTIVNDVELHDKYHVCKSCFENSRIPNSLSYLIVFLLYFYLNYVPFIVTIFQNNRHIVNVGDFIALLFLVIFFALSPILVYACVFLPINLICLYRIRNQS